MPNIEKPSRSPVACAPKTKDLGFAPLATCTCGMVMVWLNGGWRHVSEDVVFRD